MDVSTSRPVSIRIVARLNGELAKTRQIPLDVEHSTLERFGSTWVYKVCFTQYFDMPEDGLLVLTFHALLDDGSLIDIAGSSGVYVCLLDPTLDSDDDLPIGAALFAARRKMIDDALRPD
jgi:hypothetical protein